MAVLQENFLFKMSKQVLELERLGGEYLQTESWTEWREALKDWKDFFNRMTLEDHKQTENIYLNEFKRLFELRKISQFDYKTEEKKKKGCCFRAVCNFRSDLLVRYQSGDQQFSCFFF